MDQCTFETNFPQQLVKHMDSHDKITNKSVAKNVISQVPKPEPNFMDGASSPYRQSSKTGSSIYLANSSPKLSRQSSKVVDVSTRRMKYPPVKKIIRKPRNQDANSHQDINSTLQCLNRISQSIHSQIDIDPIGNAHCIRLRGDVIGCRTTRVKGVNSKELLIKWKPKGILSDEWMPFESVKEISKTIPIDEVPKSFWWNQFPVLFPKGSPISRRKRVPEAFSSI